MKDKILDWLDVIKDEDAHLYEEYMPTKKKNVKNSSFNLDPIFSGNVSSRLVIHPLSHIANSYCL